MFTDLKFPYICNMQFSKALFWDVDASKLDYEKHAGHIIPRVFMRGTLEDLTEIFSYYGKEKIKEVLLQTRYLDKLTLSFAANLFHVSKDEFRCYRLKQSTPQLWDY